MLKEVVQKRKEGFDKRRLIEFKTKKFSSAHFLKGEGKTRQVFNFNQFFLVFFIFRWWELRDRTFRLLPDLKIRLVVVGNLSLFSYSRWVSLSSSFTNSTPFSLLNITNFILSISSTPPSTPMLPNYFPLPLSHFILSIPLRDSRWFSFFRWITSKGKPNSAHSPS